VRIAIDARELCGRPTGVGRYLANLLTAWTRLPEASQHRFVVYVPTAGVRDNRLVHEIESALRVETRPLPGGSGTWWEQVHLAAAIRHDQPDVLFAPAYTAPIAVGTPVVLTVHDLSFFAHPEWFPARMRIRQRALTKAAARRAARVLTDSEFSRGEIARYLGVGPARVAVIPLGLTRPSAGRTAPTGGRPHEPMVLFVGSIFNRRHLPEVIRATAMVSRRHPEVRLEVVGDNRTYPFQDLPAIAAAEGTGSTVTARSYVSDDVLADLYARAGAFVFLSDYEGFGLTPLEALSNGVPVLVGDIPVAREVYGDAARYVSTTDVSAVAGALESLLFDAAARSAQLAAAPLVLGRYSWEAAGRSTLEALVAAAGSRR
jgi:glycosyltransferase involved in cell wall biosynthesis